MTFVFAIWSPTGKKTSVDVVTYSEYSEKLWLKA